MIRGLLDRFPGCDLGEREHTGHSPATATCYTATAPLASVRELAAHGTDLRIGVGCQAPRDAALLSACNNPLSEPALISLLLEARCSLDVAVQPPYRFWRALCAAGRLVARVSGAPRSFSERSIRQTKQEISQTEIALLRAPRRCSKP